DGWIATPHHAHPPSAPRVEVGLAAADDRLAAQRRVELYLAPDHRPAEPRRRDAHDLEPLAAEPDGRADDVGTAAVLALPEAVPQHRDGGAAAHVVRGPEQPPQRRPHPEQREVVAAHVLAEHATDEAAIRRVEVRLRERGE